MAITITEKHDSLKVTQGIRDSQLETQMVRKFLIKGAGSDATQPSVVGLFPLVNMGYFAQNSQALSAALASGTAYTSIPIAGSTIAAASGSTMIIGYGSSTQTITLSAALNVGDVLIYASFTASANFPMYTPVTPGSTAPANNLNIYCLAREFDPVPGADMVNNPVIQMTCTYGPPWRLPADNAGSTQSPTFGSALWSTEMGSENVHINTALSQTDYPTAPDVGLAINLQSDGSIQGVDIPVGKILVKASVKQLTWPKSYLAQLKAIQFTTNNAAWNGFNTGELLFLGAHAQQQGQGFYDCEYMFEYQADQSVTVPTASGNQTFTKPAHSYVWARNTQQLVSGAAATSTKDVHVAVVRAAGDFSVINFGL